MLSGGANGTGVYYSHGSLSSPSVYPYFSTVAITDGVISPLVKDSSVTGKAAFRASSDANSLLRSDGYAYPSLKADLAYVYTMPCDETIKIAANASVSATSTDGVTVSCYLNTADNAMFSPVTVTNTSNKTVASIASISLKKGDKIYYVLSPNSSPVGDTGYFYMSITYLDIE